MNTTDIKESVNSIEYTFIKKQYKSDLYFTYKNLVPTSYETSEFKELFEDSLNDLYSYIKKTYKELIEIERIIDQKKVKVDLMIQRKLRILLKEFKPNNVSIETLRNDCIENWFIARKENDYSVVKNHFEKLINETKQIAESNYDSILLNYINKEDLEIIHCIFQNLKNVMMQLDHKMLEVKNISKCYNNYSFRILIDELHEYLHDFSKNTYLHYNSEDCFSICLSQKDSHIFIANKTKYPERAYLHELGHIVYFQCIHPSLHNTIFERAGISVFSETIAILFEFFIGKDRRFWKSYKKAKKFEASHLENEDETNVFIRADSPPINYLAHILIRYEIEQEIFNGVSQSDNIKEIWNLKYEKYFNQKPNNDNDGILQDIHWASGLFGYFPLYGFSFIWAEILYEKMEKDLDLTDIYRKRDFIRINEWLKECFCKFGSSKTVFELGDKQKLMEIDTLNSLICRFSA